MNYFTAAHTIPRLRLTVLLPLAFLLLLLSANAQAFYFIQGFNHSLRQQDGVRLGYHNENPDRFWRSYLSYSPGREAQKPTLVHRPLSHKVDISLDWVIPIPGSYSTFFVGVSHNPERGNFGQAGITWLKYLETGWQWHDRQSSAYLGVNLTF